MSSSNNINNSIVFKLNSWHLGRMLFCFVWIDIIILLLFAGSVIYCAENDISSKVSSVTAEVTANELITEDPPDKSRAMSIFRGLLPDNTQNAVRNFVNTADFGTFWERIYGIRYKFWIPYENSHFVLEYDVGRIFGLFLKLFIVVLIFEVLFLIGSIGKGARAMGRALRPIAELTETARTLNNANKGQPDIQLEDLKGTIESINASRLDTRIKVSSSSRELKDLADAINGMLERIDESYRSQKRFVSDASHELRTPIAVIQGYANLLDRWGKNDEKALLESIEAIKSEADSMKDLVEQLLFLARGDNDTMHITMEDINLSELVSEIVRETEMIDPGHRFSSKISNDIYITGDAQLIKQAVRIFVDNSIKYTPTGEEIIVSAGCEGNYAKVSVQDNGIGIPGEDLPHVFDRFFRSDDSRARKTGGTGLGLSIAKWIIDRHGGTVEILSRKDLGTRVTVLLKLKV